MKTIAHLISGTAKTGKDTLHKNLNSGKWAVTEYYTRPKVFRGPWKIVLIYRTVMLLAVLCIEKIIELFYGRPDIPWYILVRPKSWCPLHAFMGLRERYAFADALKKTCNQIMNKAMAAQWSEPRDFEWFEANKDVKCIYYDGQIKSPRDIYIEFGAAKRSVDPDFWAEICATNIPKETEYKQFADITDYRFRNEKDVMERHFTVVTSRLYRGIKPGPDPSEHDLDREVTDFLFVDTTWNLIRCLWTYPQYVYHDYCGYMNSRPFSRVKSAIWRD